MGETVESSPEEEGSGAVRSSNEDARSTQSRGVDPMPPDPWADWLMDRGRHRGHPGGLGEWQEPPTFGLDPPLRRESGSGMDSSWGHRPSGGRLSDGEIRNFNTAQVGRMTAMHNGRWAGSFDEPYYQRGSEVMAFGEPRDLKPTEKISVPEFSGEGSNDTEVGKSARSYVRKVQVWLRCTRLPPDQRALALYSALSDRAWVYAEELNMDVLSSAGGVDYFLEWIQTRFMEVEMSKISQMMNDLFRRCKRRSDQSVRDFNVEFERMVLRLHEVRCELPPLVKAWLYVDKLRLSESEELALLASCGNEYDCKKLQQAALIQDRSMRHAAAGNSSGPGEKGWRGGGKWRQSVHMTVNAEEEASSDEYEPNNDTDGSFELVEEEVAQEHHTAYLAYQGAKSKYKEAMKGRGTDPEALQRQADEKLRLAKMRSFCSVCKRRGHWHRDEICPARQQQQQQPQGKAQATTPAPAGGGQSAHVTQHRPQECHAVTNVCYMTFSPEEGAANICNMTNRAEDSNDLDFMAIIDTACTKSVAGYQWFEKFYKMSDALGLPYDVLDETDSFKFSASKVFTSTFAVRAWFAVEGRWFSAKIAIVPCQVPLLFSKPVLALLGMKFDLTTETISLSSLGVEDLKIQTCSSGHPALLVSNFPENSPPEYCGGVEDEAWVPAQEGYTALAARKGSTNRSFGPTSSTSTSLLNMTSTSKGNNIFYPKKIPIEIHNMLTDGNQLHGVTFFAWWKQSKHANDFWIETDDEMIRVHVIPRRHLFDPFAWKTKDTNLKNQLNAVLGKSRVTEAVACLQEGIEVWKVSDSVLDDDCTVKQPWIGRTRFPKLKFENTRPREQQALATSADVSGMPSALGVEAEQGGALGGAVQTRGSCEPFLDRSRVAPDPHGDLPGGEAQGRDERCHEGYLQGKPRGVDQEGNRLEDRGPTKGHPRMVDPRDQGSLQHPGRDCGDLRQVQGVDVQGGAPAVPGLEHRGSGCQRCVVTGVATTGQLGQAEEGPEPGKQSSDTLIGNRPRSSGQDSSAHDQGSLQWPKQRRFVVPSFKDIGEFFQGQRQARVPSGQEDGVPGGRDQDAGGKAGHAQAEEARVGCDERRGRRLSDVAVDKTVYGKGGDYIVRPAEVVAENAIPDPLNALEEPYANPVEYEVLAADDSDLEDFIQDEPFVPEEIYYTKTMNPKALGSGVKDARQRAKDGVRRRKLMNEPTYKKVKRNIATLATVFAACTVAAVGYTQDLISGPFADTNEIFEPFVQWMTEQPRREVDCYELFAGRARISEAFAKRGRGVLQPRDIKFGHDLRDPELQREVLDDIRRFRPGLVWMAPPCTLWCGFSKLNYSPQELRRRRRHEMELVRFAGQVMELQHQLGGIFVVENPRNSDLWRTDVIQDLAFSPQMSAKFAKADLCQYGMKSHDGMELLRKPVSLFTNSSAFSDSIEVTCDRTHEHRVIQGAETSHSATYPTAFATAVFRAYVKAIKPEAQQVLAATSSSTSSSTGTSSSSSTSQAAQQDGALVPVPEEDEEEVESPPLEESHGARAISFKGKVNPQIATVLKRVHQNLGHPSNRELVKHLKVAGAGKPILQAAEQLHCRTCAKTAKAPSHNVSAPVVALDFNEAVALDVIWLDTLDVTNKPALNVVDLASTYQVVLPLSSTKSEDIAEAFANGWLQWAGAPRFVLVDLDSGFKDRFLTLMNERSILVRATAGQAHWQNGVAERHGGSWKMIWEKFVQDYMVFEDEMSEAMGMVSDAKNQLRNRSGYSPRQWVFGSNGRQPSDIFDMNDTELEKVDIASPDSKFARTQVLRVGARASFYACQTKDAVQRALHHKSRVKPKEMEIGDLAYAYRQMRQGKGKKPTPTWLGPGIIIGKEGSNFWMSRGGRCILVAPEHLRPADHEEVSETLRLKTAMHELKQLLDSPWEDELIEEDHFYEGPGPDDPPQGEEQVEMEAEEEDSGELPALPPVWEQAASREDMIRTSVRRAKALDDVPAAIKRARLEAPRSVFMVKRCISEKGKEKQLEKELPWGMIPPDDRHLYREQELKQWKEHVEFGAVRALSHEESREVLRTVPSERILSSRFAYRDKNHALRKADPTVPCKPKARLCIAGHRDPDLGRYDMAVDAPTTSRHSILLALQLGLCRGWRVSVGDIRAAFLNGVPAPRKLYFKQPRGGIPSLEEGQLVEVIKGVFGLSTSPKLWWMKLSKDILDMTLTIHDDTLVITQNVIDPCVFQIISQKDKQVKGLLLTHVDDLMLVIEEKYEAAMQTKIKNQFPVDEWESGTFNYVGCKYHCTPDEIQITQEDYVDGRIDKVTAKASPAGEVTKEQIEENRTSIGSLSWLAKQTRPDLQFGVSQAQRKQSNPSLDDIKKTNKLVDSATENKKEGIILKRLDESKATFVAFHDAAWGNVDLPEREEGDPLWLGDHPVSSQLAHVILISEKEVMEGQERQFSLVDWRSKSSQRVCRSTFAGETMACCEAVEHTIYLRSLFVSFAKGMMIPEDQCGAGMPMHFITDCRSLFDHLHREGTPKAPTEKRLAIDLAGLRQVLNLEAKHQFCSLHGAGVEPTPDLPCRVPLHWIPTELQLADVLTKEKKGAEWWASVSKGKLFLPFKNRRDQYRF